MPSPRLLAKTAFERLVVGSGLSRLLRRNRRSHGLVLAYHNIVPPGEAAAGDASLHLPQATFARQLDLLQLYAKVVTLDELLESTGSGERPRVAVTFDDAYLGAVTAGIQELRARALPATIFVAPAFLGGHSFWWDAVTGARGLDRELRDRLLSDCGGSDARVRAWASEAGMAVLDPPAHARAASERELEEALSYPGLTLGSHTWTHPNLTLVNEDGFAAELVRPLDWLRQRFGGRVQPWLSYPYGLADARVERAAAAAGYAAAWRVEGGWMPPQIGPRFGLPRFNVPAGLSDDGFRLRLAGLFCR